MSSKSFAEVLEKIRTLEFKEEFDMIVAIANGGSISAGLLNPPLYFGISFLGIALRVGGFVESALEYRYTVAEAEFTGCQSKAVVR